MAWLLGLFGANPPSSDGLRRVEDALRVVGLEPTPPLADAPARGRVAVKVAARRVADRASVTGREARRLRPPSPGWLRRARRGSRSLRGGFAAAGPIVSLAAAVCMPVLATVALGAPTGTAFLLLALVGLMVLRLSPPLLRRARAATVGARALRRRRARTAAARREPRAATARRERREAAEEAAPTPAPAPPEPEPAPDAQVEETVPTTSAAPPTADGA